MAGDVRGSTSACLEVALSSNMGKNLVKLTALDVDCTGRIAALANNKVLALLDLNQQDKPPDFLTQKSETPGNAVTPITWNPHYNRRRQLASTKGNEIMIWNTEDTTKPAIGVLCKHQTTVTDISWSPTQEETLASASNSSSSIYIWDMRTTRQTPAQEMNKDIIRDFTKNHVKEINALAKGARLAQVKFNRKNSHLLASAHGNQVCIWDTRKVRAPVLHFPAHPPLVVSLDWSYESEYDLVTGGGDTSVKLWTLATSEAKRVTSRIGTAQPQRSLAQLQATSPREQPVQKVMCTPFGQGVLTSCRGMWEEEQASQTLQLWSVVPRRRFDLVTAFEVGTARILGSCWRKTSEGQYQIVSLDTADHLRLHNVTASHRRACGNFPVGDSPAFKDYGSTAGSEMVEALSSKIKMSDLRSDLVPVVWKFSNLQGIPSERVTGQISSRELAQVESFADRGDFGRVSDKRLDLGRSSLSLTMHAASDATSSFSANEMPVLTEWERGDTVTGRGMRSRIATGGGDAKRSDRNPTAATPVRGSGLKRFEATARLRVVLTVPAGYHTRGEHPQIQLFSAGGYVAQTNHESAAPNGEDPLNTGTLKRLRESAEDAMRQALKMQHSRLEAGLLKLKDDLAALVSNVAKHAAGVTSNRTGAEPLSQLQFGFDGDPRSALSENIESWKTKELGEPKSRLVGSEVIAIASDSSKKGIVPCPRRFGATFSPNGTLVIFASAHVYLQVRMDEGSRSGSSSLITGARRDWRIKKQATSLYPRTYANLVTCLKDGQEDDVDEGRIGHDFVPSIPWVDGDVNSSARSRWGDHLGGVRDRNTFDLDAYSSEGSSAGDENELNTELGPNRSAYIADGSDRTEGDPLFDADEVEGRLPWTPRSNKVILLDCGKFLPGSSDLACYYTLGPWQQLPSKRDVFLQPPAPPDMATMWETNHLFADNHGSSAKAEVTPSSRQRRHSLKPGATFSLGGGITAPPLLKRGVSATIEIGGRGIASVTGTNLDAAQGVPPNIGKLRQCDSTPDFKILRGRSGGLNWGGWGTTLSAGPHVITGSPALGAGSPSRWEMPRNTQRLGQRTAGIDELIVGSPHQHQLNSDVMELPLAQAGANLTPPRHYPLSEEVQFEFAAGQRTSQRMRSGSGGSGSKGSLGTGVRQRYPLRRNTNTGSGPSPPTESLRIRQGLRPPSSPATTPGVASNSPPMSDFGLEPGHVAGVLGTPSSGMTDVVVAEGSVGGTSSRTGRGFTGAMAEQVTSMERTISAPHSLQGLSGGVHFGIESTQSGVARSRSETGIWHGSVSSGNDGPVDDTVRGLHGPSVGDLCRKNAAVALKIAGTSSVSRTWAILAATADVAALEKLEGHTHTRSRERRRLTETILRHYEALGDTQMLATMVCVLSSASSGGGVGSLLPQEEPRLLTYERYLAVYAELLYVWGADEVRWNVLNHLEVLKNGRLELHVHTPRKQSRSAAEPSNPIKAKCSVCENKVFGTAWICDRCGHGGHDSHIQEYFENTSACIICGCQCRSQRISTASQ